MPRRKRGTFDADANPELTAILKAAADVRWNGRLRCPVCGTEHGVMPHVNNPGVFTCAKCSVTYNAFTELLGNGLSLARLGLRRVLKALLILRHRPHIKVRQYAELADISHVTAHRMLRHLRTLPEFTPEVKHDDTARG